MLSLSDKRWSELLDAYGPAERIPELLRRSESLPEDSGYQAEPYFSLWSALYHQGEINSASYAALPHLVRIVGDNPARFRWTMLSLVQAIETARQETRGPVVPADLEPAYVEALEQVAAICCRLLANNLDELELRVVLSCIASAKGFGPLSEAISELTPDVVVRLLDVDRFE